MKNFVTVILTTFFFHQDQLDQSSAADLSSPEQPFQISSSIRAQNQRGLRGFISTDWTPDRNCAGLSAHLCKFKIGLMVAVSAFRPDYTSPSNSQTPLTAGVRSSEVQEEEA